MSPTSENPVQNKVIYETLQNILPEETAEGNPISITDASGLDAKSALVTFAPKQSGTGDPSPTNVRPFILWDGLSLFQSNKNMFDKTDVMSGYKLTASGGTTSGSSFFVSDYIYLPEGDYIAEKIVGTNNGYGLFTYDENKTKVRDLTPSGSTADKSFTIQSGERYIRLSALLSRIDEVQLELGSTATEYEPHQGETYTVTFPETIMGGSYDFVSGVATVEWVAVDMGSISYEEYADGFYRFDAPNGIISGNAGSSALDNMCSAYPLQSDVVIAVQQLENLKMAKCTNSSKARYYFRNDNYTTPEAFATAMSGQTFCYKLATPQEITLTPEEIELLKGANVISTDGDTVQIKYSADIAAYIDKKIAESEG